jgi:hypothetical protein
VVVVVAGVVVAHAIDYGLVFPDATVRRARLEATGHGYWSVAVAMAVVAGALAVAAAVARGAERHRRDQPTAGLDPLILAAWMGATFLALEVVERLVAGAPAASLVRPEIGVGLLLQAVVAFAAARLLGAVERATERAVAAGRPTPSRRHRTAVVRLAMARTATPTSLALATLGPRAPPRPA